MVTGECRRGGRGRAMRQSAERPQGAARLVGRPGKSRLLHRSRSRDPRAGGGEDSGTVEPIGGDRAERGSILAQWSARGDWQGGRSVCSVARCPEGRGGGSASP